MKSAGLSTVGVELSRDSVGTMWEAAERKVKGDDGDGSDRQIEETFLEMISELVDTGTSLQLKVNKLISDLLIMSLMSTRYYSSCFVAEFNLNKNFYSSPTCRRSWSP